MKKRVLSAALALCILLGLLPTAAFAQEGGGTEPAEPVETAGILIGATRFEEMAPKLSKSLLCHYPNGEATYTLTFSGRVIPDYYTEARECGDGTETYEAEDVWKDGMAWIRGSETALCTSGIMLLYI